MVSQTGINAGVCILCVHLYSLIHLPVERRQAKVMETAVHTNAIVTSLFPSNVRERLFNTEQSAEQKRKFEHNKTRLKTFLSDGKIDSLESAEAAAKQSPIADLFPHCTVLFSDISGFTAWSSVREPSQVFTLLETLYGAFDSIAIKRGVFKVSEQNAHNSSKLFPVSSLLPIHAGRNHW